jgi:hypothetical protein
MQSRDQWSRGLIATTGRGFAFAPLAALGWPDYAKVPLLIG